MESSRDSSVWQTLAVTFGGGLALGAVGMKLTQNVRRPAEPVAPPDDHPLANRLAEIEQRLARVEYAPAPSTQLDHKVLEAIVGAVDVKLQEQSLKIESRVAALEAKMALEIDALRAQNTAGADSNKACIKEVESQFLEQMLVLRTAVVDELNHFGEAVSTLITDQVSAEVSARASALEQTIEARIGTAAADAVAASLEESLAPLRAEVERKERELGDIKSRLSESEHNVLDVILAIGQVCRQAAERISGPSYPSAGAPPELGDAPEQPAPTPIAPAPPALESNSATGIAPPAFTEKAAPSRLWRIPLVSSLLISTTGFLLLHYL
jgi:hypothetical protein